MGIEFTTEQQKVIDLRDCNLLVSAAAGSGKTAVLVERILTRLMKDEPQIDIDRLLIVTYTEAAAAEMRERIHDAIEKALIEHPDNLHLQRQSTLVHRAMITTIHGFCQSVIRDYFHTIDLEPNFRVGEDGELKLLKKDVLDEVLEGWYADGVPEFLEFLESYAAGKDDRAIEDMVLKLYQQSRSYPDAKAWLETCVEHYDVPDVDALERASFTKVLVEEIQRQLEAIAENIEFAKELCVLEDGPYTYVTTLDSDLKQILGLRAISGFANLSHAMQRIEWSNLEKKPKTAADDKVKMVQGLRNQWKKSLGKLVSDYFSEEPKLLCEDLLVAKGNMEIFARLTEEFAECYREKKKEKHLIDFDDMLYYALQILTEKQGSRFVPSAAAREYQEQFVEIMIDEYQDSNLLQDTILSSVSKVTQGEPNVFMVGDVKQSIYRFQLSRPELFMEKYDTYSEAEGDRQKIDLHMNFRSRKEVLDAANFVFEQNMIKDFGGIAYDDKAALYHGAKNYAEMDGNETELLLLNTKALDAAEDKQVLEARMIAGRIKELVGSHEIYDKKTDGLRKAEYRDIVILVRALRGWADTFALTLAEEGIPAHSISKEGYFKAKEIQLMLNYLRILDNPRQDIPFASVLTSPFARLHAEQLVQIKCGSEEKSFYEKARNYAESGEDEELCLHLREFFSVYDRLRAKVAYTAIHSLLWEIMDATGYENYVAALPAGEQRMANLNMLIEKAIAFESTSYKGLFHFVRYIEQLEKYEVDYGEAGTLDENANVVRIISIHKSKGLEFPIVFVAGMGKNFNTQDAKQSVMIHPDLGVGLDAIDVKNRTKMPTLVKSAIKTKIVNESAAEELRILYVAMTRAKEKLILVSATEKLEGIFDKCHRLRSWKEKELPYSFIAGARSYLDWVIPAIYRFEQTAPIRMRFIEKEELMLRKAAQRFAGQITESILKNWNTQVIYDSEFKEQIEEQFAYSYPYVTDAKKKQKVSVSELKKRRYLEEEEIEEEEVIPLLPKFLQKETGVVGALRGTAYHRVLELLDFKQDYDAETLQMAIAEMVSSKLLEKELADSVKLADLLEFLYSEIGRRVQQAARVKAFHAEQPFVLGEQEPESESADLRSQEFFLVQGIIDVYFEENGELVVLDYKTDRVSQAEELLERYKVQLDYYARALTQITGKPVKEKIIYSFTLGQAISL